MGADEIPHELRRVVEFLNEHLNSVEVLAVEIRQFLGEGRTTLIPRIVGQTERARRHKGVTPRSRLSRGEFLELLEESRYKQAVDELLNRGRP